MAEFTQFVLEQAAQRLENGAWRKSGSPVFAPLGFVGSSLGDYPDVSNPLCLVDTLALEASKYAHTLYAEQGIISSANLMDALNEVGDVIAEEVIPVLRRIIMDDIRENYREYLPAIDSLVQLRSPGHPPWVVLGSLTDFEIAWFYNDNLCDGGESAAKIIRKVIKEL